MIGKENYLLYMIATNIAPAKECNENPPESFLGSCILSACFDCL